MMGKYSLLASAVVLITLNQIATAWHYVPPPSLPLHGVRLFQGIWNRTIPNYAMIAARDFADDDWGTGPKFDGGFDGVSDALWCQSANPGSQIGSWQFPDGSLVNTDGAPISTDHELGQVGLLRYGGLNYVGYEGMYTCTIPDQNGATQTLVVWAGSNKVYDGIEGHSVPNPFIASPTSFSLSSQSKHADPPHFTLTFTVTTAPPTYITCQVGDSAVDVIGLYREVTTGLYVSAATDPTAVSVPNTKVCVTLGTREAGDYRCTVSVFRASGSSLLDATTLPITISVTATPTSLTAMRIGYNTVRISWITPASNSPPVTGYEVFYALSSSDSEPMLLESTPSASITSVMLSDILQLGSVYDIFVVAYSDEAYSLPSGHSNTESLDLTTPQHSGLNLTSTSSSITVTWISPQIHPSGYYFSASCLRPCPSPWYSSHQVNRGGSATFATITGLSPASECTTNLRANWPDNTYSILLMKIVNTSTLEPSTPLSDGIQVTSVFNTNLTISWKKLNCSEQNGAITGYIIRYTNSSANYSEPMDVVAAADVTELTLTDLSPCTEYSLMLAAVNSVGTSNFSEPLLIDSGCPLVESSIMFQLKIGRVQDCVTMTVDRAAILEEDIIQTVASIIIESCNCTFNVSAISDGAFSCYSTRDEIIYRARINGGRVQAPHDSDHYLGHLKMWAESAQAVVVSEKRRMWVDKTCCVPIHSFSEPECGSEGYIPRCSDK